MVPPQVIRTKIIPPQKSANTLTRPRLTKLLEEALNHRLTLIQASAGYGKSTMLASLVEWELPIIWYQVTREDNDPLVFLQHLNHSTQLALPKIKGLPIPILDSWEGSRGPLPSHDIISHYINAVSEGVVSPALLILDDLHLAIDSDEIAKSLDLLLRLAPPELHILLSSRPRLNLPNLSLWDTRGQVLKLDQSHLAFTIDEISELYTKCYGYSLSQEEAENLHSITEGWAISLQLIWQSLRSNAATSISDALNRQPASLKSLFDVLANEVFGKQPGDVQDFLRISSTLRVMSVKACNAIRHKHDSNEMLSYLYQQDLFVVPLDEVHLRYQNIFRRFLQQITPADQRREWHLSAANYFRAKGDSESTIYHLLKAEDFLQAANFLEAFGNELIAQGRLNSLTTYLESLPPESFHQHPMLLSYLGDLARLHSRYQEALAWYQQAEAIWRERGMLNDVGRSLRGQARIYLDTVDPSRAEALLQEALRLSDGISDRETQARLLEMLAENKLNAGKPEESESLHHKAEKLRSEGPTDSQLIFRVMLRTGRLTEARQALEKRVEAERLSSIRLPRAHRESLFLLSLIYSFQGEAEAALHTAIEGTQLGVDLDSPYMKAVGHMRQGHALMLVPSKENYSRARQQFQQAIEISHELVTPRLRVEANWGLCRAFGFQGELSKAHEAAKQGIKIALQAGDEWIASQVRTAYGASLTLARRFKLSEEWLLNAGRGFHDCSDRFGYTATRLWLCIGWYLQDDYPRLAQVLPEVLVTCRKFGYDFLFKQPTLLGFDDIRSIIPMLLFARENNWESGYIDYLLDLIGLPNITMHPGYQLRVYTLGTFQAWLGDTLIQPDGWRREKTRHLFQLMITNRDAPLDREQIFEHLWPGADPSVSTRNFKVALNTLYNVLEPARKPGNDSTFILREGTIYGLRPGADIWLDADIFTALLNGAENIPSEEPFTAIPLLEKAIGLYSGEYLPDTRYENWAAIERENLSVKFLRAADRLCELYLQRKQYRETIELSQQILQQDNCWERAYRHMMSAYSQMGDHGQMARTYQRCLNTLRSELDVPPSLETENLFENLKSKTSK